MTVRFIETDADRVGELHKRATALSGEGRLSEAIDCLRMAQGIMRANTSAAFAVQQWLRLPLFLQQAGLFDEAMAEFERLIEEADGRALSEHAHLPDDIALCTAHSRRARIYDKMRLACKRQKRADLEAHYEKLAHDEQRKADAAQKKVLAWQKKKRTDWERAKNNPKAQEAFFVRYPERYR
ncbi:MAG: hypothetical protein N2690_01790 [Rhodocyclaceae bacterium]|nr:hypothetical protein [Rhodocyclaceae bacterium]